MSSTAAEPDAPNEHAPRPTPERRVCHRRVIVIRAEDSPNVRLGMAQEAAGLRPTDEVRVPGVLGYFEYLKRRKLWDAVRQSVGLDAQFWCGADALLYPPQWLNLAEQRWALLPRHRKACGIGVDPAEGGDKTSLAASDRRGLVELLSVRTPDTSQIPGMVIDFMRRHGVPADRVVFDRGGGGKQIADHLRAMKVMVRTVGFGESVRKTVEDTPRPKAGLYKVGAGPAGLTGKRLAGRKARSAEELEQRYVFKNRRAEMYGTIRILTDPSTPGEGFALPPPTEGEQYQELRRQLSLLPLCYDGEGRMYLPPKRKRGPNSTERTLKDILGCSPDEADAVAMSVYAAHLDEARRRVGAMFH